MVHEFGTILVQDLTVLGWKLSEEPVEEFGRDLAQFFLFGVFIQDFVVDLADPVEDVAVDAGRFLI